MIFRNDIHRSIAKMIELFSLNLVDAVESQSTDFTRGMIYDLSILLRNPSRCAETQQMMHNNRKNS